MKPVLIVIGGPTASGKTDLAIEAAKHFNTQIISADSRQCYRELSIGTAKPAQEQLELIPHHFINSHSITEIFNAGKFADAGSQLLVKLFLQNQYVIVAGGSGLYIKALTEGLDEFPEIKIETRKKLQEEFKSGGIDYLRNELEKCDPEYFRNADIRNPRRIIRALEVFRETGKPYSSFLKKNQQKHFFDILCFTTNLPRETLYQNIDLRTGRMIADGLVEEAEAVLPYRYHPALQTVGYREIFEFRDGNCDLQTAISKIKQHTRNYAKRQVTWFRNQGNFSLLDPGNPSKSLINQVENHGAGTF